MCPLLKLWLQDGGTFFDEDLSITSTIAMVLPADPMRFLVMAGNGQSVLILGGFGFDPPTNPVFMFGTGTPGLKFTRDEIGDLITQPLWLKSSGTAIASTLHTMSYNAARYHKAMKWIEEYVSRS